MYPQYKNILKKKNLKKERVLVHGQVGFELMLLLPMLLR
jgi:hypothetical protein